MNPKLKVNRPIKLQAIKIKDQIESTDQIYAHQIYQQPKFNQFLNQLSGIFTKLSKTIQKTIQKQNRPQINNCDLEPRDRSISVNLPQCQDGNISKSHLEQWITQVSRKTFSTAFNNYFKDQMTFEQTKIYCSENILRNIALLAQKINITTEHMQIINFHIKNRVLPYMNSKYPMTASTDINKAFEKTVKEIDNWSSTTYDLIIDTKVNFQYRESGNYSDLIMRFLNQIMLKIDHESIYNPEFTNFKDFQNLMTQIFLKTQDQEWINSQSEKKNPELQNFMLDSKKIIREMVNQTSEDTDKNQKNSIHQYQKKMSELKQRQRLKEIQKEKYKTKIREYTHFSINRKISENTDIFSEEQIKGLNFKIKSPAILRILTKWCQQLSEKFTNENYFTQMEQGIKIQKTGKILALYDWMKISIKNKIINQKRQIDKFLKQIKQNNHYFQSALFTKQMKELNFFNQVDKIQRACAKTSINIVDSFHSYIIQYLNLLIHSLLKTAKQFYDKDIAKNWIDWKQSPVNLITFKIGDLMRCKCSSKEKEILKVFKQIERLSEQNPNKIKIIRIKNRLKLGTNDILINVRFNQEINCQIQLAIHSNKSKFINCSSAFNHYLYELQRSLMDPITEMCCVWTNLDSRFRVYNKMINSQPKKKNEAKKCKQNQSHDLQPSLKPFICNICQIAYSHNIFIKNNLKCSKCKFWTCAKCLIQQQQPQKLAQSLFKDQKIRNTSKRIRIQDQFPQYGACIKIETKRIKVEYFQCLQIKGKKTLFGVQKKKIYEIQQITTQKQKEKFFDKYLVYFSEQIKNKISFINRGNVTSEIILPNYLKQCSQKYKQTLKFLNYDKLKKQDWKTLFKLVQKNKFKQVKNIIIKSSQLEELNFINEDQFPSLEEIGVDFNRLNDREFKSLARFKNLKRLYIAFNGLTSLPNEIDQLTSLQQLGLAQNKLSQIPQTFFGKLKNLLILNLSQNKLKALPLSMNDLQHLKTFDFQKYQINNLNSIKSLKNIQTLIASNNIINELPDQVQWKKLKFLKLTSNKIQKIPDLFLHLPNIQILLIDQNQIQSIPSSIKQMKFLVQLNVYKNKISLIPQQINELQNLKTFKFQDNNINRLPKSLQKLKNLETLQMNLNQLQYFQYLSQIKDADAKIQSIKKLQLGSNNLILIPIFIQHLQNLIELRLDHNHLETLDEKILEKLVNLKILNLQHNKLKQIPNFLCNLQQLQTLTVSNNQISEIPKDLTKLVNLKHLSFNANSIKYQQDIKCFMFVFKIANLQTTQMIRNLPLKQVNEQNSQSEKIKQQ